MDTTNETPGGMPPVATPPPSTPPSGDHNPNMALAVLAYLGILVIIPLVSAKKDDPFVKFHCKQGLVLLIGWVLVGFLGATPLIWTISSILSLGLVVLSVLGIVNVVNNKMEPLPLVGHLGDKFNF